jgi:DNA-binding SARP family transcriptional activator
METLDVRLFGMLNIRSSDGSNIRLHTPRVQELFCYLVLKRDQVHPRELLFDLFWRNSPPAQARRNLRQTLWQIQSCFNSELCSDVRVVFACAAWVQITPNIMLHTDVTDFEQAFKLAQGMPSDSITAQQATALQAAVDLYQGDLLEGWYSDWCLVERERLQTMYLAMLDQLMGFCDLNQRYDRGLDYGARVLRYDRANERTHRRMMRMLYLSGNRSAALQQYKQCTAALREELDVAPSTRTAQLYAQIQSDTLEPKQQFDLVEPSSAGAGIRSGSLVDMLDRLRRMRDVVTSVQTQLRQDIQMIDTMIDELSG